jgi:hypothetical protein
MCIRDVVTLLTMPYFSFANQQIFRKILPLHYHIIFFVLFLNYAAYISPPLSRPSCLHIGSSRADSPRDLDLHWSVAYFISNTHTRTHAHIYIHAYESTNSEIKYKTRRYRYIDLVFECVLEFANTFTERSNHNDEMYRILGARLALNVVTGIFLFDSLFHSTSKG